MAQLELVRDAYRGTASALAKLRLTTLLFKGEDFSYSGITPTAAPH
jgi:uncharacterized protein with PIN domain